MKQDSQQDLFKKIVLDSIRNSTDALDAFESVESNALQTIIYTALGAYQSGSVVQLKEVIMPFLNAEFVRVQNERDNREQQLNN